jgi:hypothetical protein
MLALFGLRVGLPMMTRCVCLVCVQCVERFAQRRELLSAAAVAVVGDVAADGHVAVVAASAPAVAAAVAEEEKGFSVADS